MTHRQFLETTIARLKYQFLRPKGSTRSMLVLLHKGLGSLNLRNDFLDRPHQGSVNHPIFRPSA